jgi:hypothetical protein
VTVVQLERPRTEVVEVNPAVNASRRPADRFAVHPEGRNDPGLDPEAARIRASVGKYDVSGKASAIESGRMSSNVVVEIAFDVPGLPPLKNEAKSPPTRTAC